MDIACKSGWAVPYRDGQILTLSLIIDGLKLERARGVALCHFDVIRAITFFPLRKGSSLHNLNR